jgi:hypothetical protein
MTRDAEQLRDWLDALAESDLAEAEVRGQLAARLASAEEVERAALDVGAARRAARLTELADELAASVLTVEEVRAHLVALVGSEGEVESALRQVEAARGVRELLARLRLEGFEAPAGFEARLLARVHQDEALRGLVEAALAGAGRALGELLNLLLEFLPAPPRAGHAPA